jgi:hypothetical protein
MEIRYGICSVCRERRALRGDGTLRRHLGTEKHSNEWPYKRPPCAGSTRPPVASPEQTEIYELGEALARARAVVRDLLTHHDRLAEAMMDPDNADAYVMMELPTRLAERAQYELEQI